VRPEELRALGDLAADAAAGIAQQAREVHTGVAGRVFGALRPLGLAVAPVRTIHDAVAVGSYTGAQALSRGIVRAAVTAASMTRPPDAAPIGAGPRGRIALGAINGAWGDRLHGRGSVLETPMAVRVGGCDVRPDPAALAAAFPAATGRLAVFIHGLGETEDAWRLYERRCVPYGDRLRVELGYTPVFVRYNTGRHISHNGRALAELLDDVVCGWPVPVSELALIGHSMGGLVARGACHYAPEGSWRERVRHVFLLGSPLKGAPLELGAKALCHVASRVPELAPLASPVRARAVGVKDLGYGYVVDEDWLGHDPDAFWSNTGTEVPFLSTATHYFFSATISRDPDAPAGRLLGDLLVLRPSAWAQRHRFERLRFDVDQYRHLGGATHFDLLNHPAVYAQIRRWLQTRPRQLPATTSPATTSPATTSPATTSPATTSPAAVAPTASTSPATSPAGSGPDQRP
jgi:pimeloyl-ACP methyl ester carboxylesterase